MSTSTPKAHESLNIHLREIFTYDAATGVVCIYCRNAKIARKFANGKKFDVTWKLDFLKRHLTSKMHLNSVQKLRQQNHSLPATGILRMLYEVSDDQERKRAKPEQI